MGRYRYGEKKSTYYCPKCGKKKLEKNHSYSGGGYYQTWSCSHNAEPRTWRARRRRQKQVEEGKTFKVCGLVIAVDGRDAEIEDYHDVLGKMARIKTPAIQTYLLEHDRNIHKRGLEVLYVGELVSLVRRRDGEGVGVALYWNANTWDDDEDVMNPVSGSNLRLFQDECTQYVKFNGVSISDLLRRDGQDIWLKDDGGAYPFTGGLGKRLKARLVEFTTQLEKALPDVIKRCEAERTRWADEKAAFIKAVNAVNTQYKPVQVTHYNGETKTAVISVRAVSAREAREIGKVLDKDISLVLNFGDHRQGLSPDKAIEVCDLLGGKIEFALGVFGNTYGVPQRRVTLSEALDVATILTPARI